MQLIITDIENKEFELNKTIEAAIEARHPLQVGRVVKILTDTYILVDERRLEFHERAGSWFWKASGRTLKRNGEVGKRVNYWSERIELPVTEGVENAV